MPLLLSIASFFRASKESDPRHVKRKIHLPMYNGDETWELPIASTHVIGQDQTTTYAFADANYANRADPQEVVTHVEELVAGN